MCWIGLAGKEGKLNTIETKAENANEQTTAVRIENGSFEVRLKKLELDRLKSQDMSWGDVEHMLVQFCVDKKGFAEDKVKIERAHQTHTSCEESYESNRPQPICWDKSRKQKIYPSSFKEKNT